VTFAGLAGIPPHPDWEGVDLLALSEDRPLFSYNEGVLGDHLAIIDGARKVMTAPAADALERGEYNAAFDLDDDPGEQADLRAGEPAWVPDMCRAHAALVREQDELRAIGYGGD